MNSVSGTDKEILEGMIRGDRNALERLYSNCFPTVSRMIILNNGTEDEAKDVFQEAVLVLYDKVVHRKDFELNCLLRTYLYAVSRRLWLKSLKEKGRFIADSDLVLDNEDSTETNAAMDTNMDLSLHLEKEAQFEKMEQCLDQLGEPCRKILLDFYMEGKSMQQICEQLGYSNADNVKNQKYKCLKRLKKIYFGSSK